MILLGETLEILLHWKKTSHTINIFKMPLESSHISTVKYENMRFSVVVLYFLRKNVINVL